MYCQSCQTRLSTKDRSCPTCGRRVGTSRDLGAGSADDESKSFPLPPAKASDGDSASGSKASKGARPKQRSARKADSAGETRAERRKARAQPAPEPPPESGFGLRPQDVLRLLAEQPSLVEPGLAVHSEDGEKIGVGFPTAVGDIDLLARDDSGAWVIVVVAEPERGKEIVGDLLQLVGWVRRHLAQSGEEVRGVVLLDDMPDDLGYAAAAVADTIEFKLYQLALTFEPVIL